MDRPDEREEEELAELQERSLEGTPPPGWRPAQETVEAVEQPGEAVSPEEGYAIRGDAGDVGQLGEAFERLESAEAGHSIVGAIREHSTTTQFGPTRDDAVAQYDSERNEITIHEDLRDASPEVLAAHLAHEGTHVQWNEPDSIDQEYHAFKAEDEVWREIKGNQSDSQCDWVSALMARGEADAKVELRRLEPYRDLPDHWPPDRRE